MTDVPMPDWYRTLGRRGVVAAVIGIAGLLILLNRDRAQFFQSYLFAWVFWTNLTIGCLLYVLLIGAVKARWGIPILRLFEAGAGLLPLMFVLFLPVLFGGLIYLYPWANPAEVARDHILQHKSWYMQPTWFGMRTVFYFVLLYALAYFAIRWSRDQDRTGNPMYVQYRSSLGAVGIVLLILTVTFASTDWVMSLSPHYFSTIFGFIFADGEALSALALITLFVTLQARTETYAEYVTPDETRDIGNLMLTFVMVWAYFALSQWLITWSGNLTQEIQWYLTHLRNGLLWLGAFIVIFQFFVPFLMLIASRTKRTPKLMAQVAALLLIVRIVDIFWIVTPLFHRGGLVVTAGDILAFVGIGGLWLAMFTWALSMSPIFPRVLGEAQEAMEHA